MNLSIPAGVYSTQSITSSTNKRDVSQILEYWAHKETPFLNRLSWGPESGGLIIEWVHEHLGWMYVECSAAIATNGTTFLCASGVGGLSQAEQTKQLRVGSLLYATGVASSGEQSGDHAWMAVSTIGASYTVTVAFLSSTTASIAASSKIYIVASHANEGSEPDRDTSRKRTLLSNKMAILRKDIQISGSQAQTEMHAVPSEVKHQMKMRLLELQFERERSVLYGWGQARSSTAAGLVQGMAELLLAQSTQSFVDDATTALSEDTFNDLVADVVDNGGSPNVVVGSSTQIRKFTKWSQDRIRSRPDNRVGGSWITSYLTDTGIEVDLISLTKAIPSFLFVLDTDKISPRAKKGRKLLLQKLGLKGDYEQWQILSEYSIEHHGVAQGHHGMFSKLA